MELLQIKYFVELAHVQHLTKLAEMLSVTPSAISSSISRLEAELNVKLFDRIGRNICLSHYGQAYLPFMEAALQAIENGNSALQDIAGTIEKQVSVAVGTPLVWAPLFHGFYRKYPMYTLKQSSAGVTGLVKLIQEMKVDFVIAGEFDFPNENLSRAWLEDQDVYLAVSPDSHLAGRESITMEELKNESFISLPTDTLWRNYCDSLFKQAGYSTKSPVECDYTMRASLVAGGFGVALTSAPSYAIDLLKPNKYIRITDDYAKRRIFLFWNPKRYMSQAAKHFKNYCVEERPTY